MDDLISRLQNRAADPDRRTSLGRSTGLAMPAVGGVDQLMAMLTQRRAQLDLAVRAAQSGRVHPQSHAAAREIAASMVASGELPGPATPEALADAEKSLSVELPALVRRLYVEIADGGFGPGPGLLPLAGVVATYRRMRSGGELPRNRVWPEGLVPVVNRDPDLDCVEAATGRVITWNPESLTERSREKTFAASFSEVSPTVESWLAAWVDEPTVAERTATLMQAEQVRAARAARASIAATTPEERRAMGLPDIGWERLVWSGIGLEDD